MTTWNPFLRKGFAGRGGRSLVPGDHIAAPVSAVPDGAEMWRITASGTEELVGCIPKDGGIVSTVRHEGSYVEVDGRWIPTKTILRFLDAEDETVTLYDDAVRDRGSTMVPVSEVTRMVDVAPWCVYRGLKFNLTRVFDAHGQLVWHDVPRDSDGFEAMLIYYLNWPEWRRVSKWKGFVYHDPRELGLIEGRVPLLKIEDYGEVVTEIPIPGREGASA